MNMSKPWKTKRAGSQQTQSPRVALDEGIVQDQPPRKRQRTKIIKVLPENPQAAPDHVPGFRIRPLGDLNHRDKYLRAWCLDFRHRGKRFFKFIGHADSMDETAARAIAAQVIGEVKIGIRHRPITPNERRFEVFAATFFRRYAPNWKPVTLAGSCRACESWLMPFFRDMDVGTISPELWPL